MRQQRGPAGGRKRIVGAVMCGFVMAVAPGGCATVTSPAPNNAEVPEGAIVLANQGSFEAGGSRIVSEAGATSCDHGHVEFQVPVNSRATALFFWHSSSAAVWQRRWDGGDGFRTIFLRRHYPVYIWDGPRVGRANYGCVPYTFKPPEGADQNSFRAWRFGPQAPVWFDGVQFPTADAAALDQAMRARYDEFDTVANAQLEAHAAAKALDRVGPAVLVTNSAAGLRAMLTALQSDHVAAIVAYETPGLVWPDDVPDKKEAGRYGPVYVPPAEFARLTRIPIQLVWGDNVRQSLTWGPLARESERWAALVNARGGKVEVIHLPDRGVHGNTHIPFADLNNVAVADLLSQFLARNDLDRHSGDPIDASPDTTP